VDLPPVQPTPPAAFSPWGIDPLLRAPASAVGRTPTPISDNRRYSLAPNPGKQVGVKPYLLFTYYAGRPLGGVKDFLGDFDSIEEALENLLEERTRYYQVVDTESMSVVKEGLAWFKDFDTSQFRRERV
jgi:hypothetical protein